MKAPKLNQAEQLRKHREAFERAMRDNITIKEAEKRIALEQIELTQRAIDEVRAGGPVHGARRDATALRLDHNPSRRPLWWQKDQYE